MTDIITRLLEAAEAEPHASPRLINACRSTRTALAQQAEQDEVGINGLTEAETNATMSVMGLSKPMVVEPMPPIYYMRDNHTFKKVE